MPLDQAARTAYKTLEKELKTTFREKARLDSLIVLNGRRVIPLKKWKKLAKTVNDYEILRYLPNGFTYFYSDFKETSNQKIIAEREKWIVDYETYLSNKEDPGFGNLICRHCLFYPTSDAGSAGMLNAILRGIEHDSTNVPCNVVNYFECPNKKLANDPKIFDYYKYGRIFYKRMHFAHMRSRDDNQKTFEIDYENDTVCRYGHRFGYFREGTISSEIREMKLHRTSEIPMMTTEDIMHCFGDEKSLLALFEQYEHAEDSKYLPEWTVKSESDEIKLARESKNEIIRFFMSLKEKITREDFEILSDEILDKKQMAQDESVRNSQRTKFSEEIQKCEQVRKSGFCAECDKFANIRCVNCDKWHCFRHWETHASSYHKFHLEDNLSQHKF